MTDSIGSRRLAGLSYWLKILGWFAMLLFACHAVTHRFFYNDFWVAMACGRHHVNHGVDTVDPFSPNSLKSGPTQEDVAAWPHWAKWITDKVGLGVVKYWHPTGWINQNWLGHVIFYWLVTESGSGGSLNFDVIVYWAVLINILIVICVYYRSRLLGANHVISVILACFAMYTAHIFFRIRPSAYTDLLVSVYLLILSLATYRNRLYIWLLVPLSIFWCNVHGGYIYAFIMLVPFVTINLFARVFKERFVFLDLKGIRHALAAGFVALMAVILFNPFHLTNLTHILVISVSEHAKSWRFTYDWKPTLSKAGDAKHFLIMLIIISVVLIVWVVVSILSRKSIHRFLQKDIKTYGSYHSPKVDLSSIAIAVLAIYMAIRATRFVIIAAIAACPVIAMFIGQIVRSISIILSIRKRNFLAAGRMSYGVRLFFATASAVLVLILGLRWGFKFKQVYIDPDPLNKEFTSVFMRMFYLKKNPFSACTFININKLQGQMFNERLYGGFLSWCQPPDPITGCIPVQIFNDGRAQAAYSWESELVYKSIRFRSEANALGENWEKRKKKLTDDDYAKVGEWIGGQLKNHNVWLVFIERRGFHYAFVHGLEHSHDWRPVFIDNIYRLYVDISTYQGRELFNGIFDGRTLYPDNFSSNFTKAHILLALDTDKATKKQGFDYALKALKLNPSRETMREIIYAAKFPELKPYVIAICKDYIDDFAKNKHLYARQYGYLHRIRAALSSLSYLQTVVQKQEDAKLAQYYEAKRKQYKREWEELEKKIKW